jgi:uncharacterized NAD(P)/FAD-binding protein YdhS
MTSDSRIAIIGAGFSGTLLAIHLLRRAEDGDRIMLFEKSPPFGRGVAYGTDSDRHLLNVRAGSMGAFEEDPAGFLTWLNGRESGDIRPLSRPVAADAFVPRRLYGRYVQHCLQKTLVEPGREYLFRPVAGEVIDIEHAHDELTIQLADGRTFAADRAVLALGNLPPDADKRPHYAGDPWNKAALADLDPEDDVLIVGTGLTMADKVLELVDRGHRGRITAISRHGLLPHVQAQDGGPHQPWRLSIPLPATSVGLLRVVRAEIERASALGRSWQDVVQALRPNAQLAWQRLPVHQRLRFLRHLRPWWDIHRHRIAPEAAVRIEQLIRSGQLSVVVGRFGGSRPAGASVIAEIRRRGAKTVEIAKVARIINCTGPRRDHSTGQSLLLRNLYSRGVVRSDPLELGLDIDRNCAVLDRYGRSSERIWATGPLTRGKLWEITAVPEIRRQVAELAARIAENRPASVALTLRYSGRTAPGRASTPYLRRGIW